VDYPLTVVDINGLKRTDLSDYHVLIMPSGYYNSRLGKEDLEKIQDWIRKGGRAIALEGALSVFEGQSGFSLKKFASESEESKDKKARQRAKMDRRFHIYEGQDRRSISNQMPGAIFELIVDDTHPLAYGLSDRYFSLKTSSRAYQLLKDTWNVAYVGKDPTVIGFAGAKAKAKMMETTVFGVQNMGRGRMIYMVDNPLFRSFWEQGKLLFGNAVFFGGM
ncbi:MAG: zinc carboxypeptidase, partial [Bacteroidota bacterium]